MTNKTSCNNVFYIGVDDNEIDLFESQYIVPQGMCYNSYLVVDEKIAIMDAVDYRCHKEWLANLDRALNGRTPDYLVVHHMEPDHSGAIATVMAQYPQMKLVCSAMAAKFIPQFFEAADFTDRITTVKEGDSLSLGNGSLTFYAATMIHWPEVLVSYYSTDKVLFSADAFGKFGVYNADADDWACEARRYYFNICGKYGAQVQALLAKTATLDITTVCPLHGPVLRGELLAEAIQLYQTWSSYEPEVDGIVIAYASIHGGTRKAAEKMAEILKNKGAKKVTITDLCRDDIAEAIEDAFKYSTMVVAASTYDGNLFPPMHTFLHKLQLKNYRRRRVGIIENGTWVPASGRIMKEMLQAMTDIDIVEPIVTIRSTLHTENVASLETLANALLK